MDNVLVSIVIINYNTFKLTCSCIESIYAMEPGLDFEIILVDNNSSELPSRDFKKKFPEIVLIESPFNTGFAKGNNLGVKQAKGKYILLLNSDTVLLNNAISRAMIFLADKPDVGVVSARLEYPDGKPQHNCQRFPSVKVKLFEVFRLQKILGKTISGKILFGPFFDYESVAYPDWVWGTFFMFRKSSLNRFPQKKLADDFFMYGEDMQWCMDFKLIGLTTAFTPEARVMHLMGMSKGEKDRLIKTHLHLFMQQYFSVPHRFLIKLSNFLLTGTYGY